MVDYRSAVDIFSIIFYSLSALLAVYFAARKFLRCVVPWLILIVFCALRITADALQLATYDAKAPSVHLLTGAIICNAIGLGPLLLASTRLLLQLNTCIHTKAIPNQTHRALITFELCIVVSTAVTIAGGVQSFRPSHLVGSHISSTPVLKAGICLYTATYVCICWSAIVVASRRARVHGIESGSPRSFSRATLILLIAQFFLAIRVIYGLLFVFDSTPKLSPVDGDETIQLCLQVLPECFITLSYIAIALYTRQLIPQAREESIETGQNGKKYLRFVPLLHWFID